MTAVICDGCMVRAPFEHRCHGDRSMVRGERVARPCECQDCKPPTEAELQEFMGKDNG